MQELLDPMSVQFWVFGAMLAAFGIGVWFVRRTPSVPPIRVHATRREREMGIKYALSSDYMKYRNPMRDLRRFCGWPSGRQWVRLRKYWNRERLDGARKFAMAVAALRRLRAPVLDPPAQETL